MEYNTVEEMSRPTITWEEWNTMKKLIGDAVNKSNSLKRQIMAKIIPTAPVTDYSELRITGALDYKQYSKMTKEELRQFILKDAAEYARKFVSEEWQDAVHIIGLYDVVDSYLTVRERVITKLVYAKEIGIDGEITLEKFNYEKIGRHGKD